MRHALLHTLVPTVLTAFLSASAIEVELDFDAAGPDDAMPSAVVKGLQGAYELNRQGIDALERGELDAAQAFFEEALSSFPGYTDAENNIGVVYFRRGTLYEARRIWQSLTKRESKYAIAWYNLGTLAFHERAYEKAITCLREALDANRRFYEAHLMLGRVYMATGDSDEALEHFERAYRINEKDTDAWSHYAFALIRSADTSAAEQILNRHRDHHEALRMLGTVAAARGKHVQAAELLQAAVERGAPVGMLVQAASSLHGAGENAQARAVVERYLERMQARAEANAWLLAGIVAKEAGDLAAARRYFQNGHRYYPDDPIMTYNLAQIHFHQKRFDKAQQLFGTLADSLQDPALFHMQALNAYRQGDLEAATALVQKALDFDKKAEYYDLLGVVAHRRGDTADARAHFKRALRLDPELRSAQLNLALSGKSAEGIARAVADARAELEACRDSCTDLAFRLSVLQYHQTDMRAAVRTLEAIPEMKRDQRIYRHLAIYFRGLHEFDKAIAALETARKRFVLELKTEHELAELLLLAGYHARAIEVLTKLIGKWDDNRWRLFYQLGYAYMERNELDKARHYFERSLKAKRDNAGAQGLLAFVHHRLGNAGMARKLWARNLKQDPTNPTLLINLGLAQEEAGNYSGALEYYRKASMLKTDDKALHINVGNAYAGMKRYTDALHAYSLALGSSRRKEAAYNAFLTALKMGNRTKARKMADILEREFSSSVFSRRAKAELSLWDGDTTAAVKLLEGIGKKNAGDRLQLARVYAARGKPAKARAHLGGVPADSTWARERVDVQARIAFAEGRCERALSLLAELEDTSFSARYNTAVTAFTCKRYQQVLSIARALVSRAHGPDRADLCRLAGNAAFAMRDWKQARHWYLQLSNIETQKPLVQYNLAVAYYNLGDTEKAWAHYERARRLDSSIRNEDIEKRYHTEAAAGTDSSRVVLNTLDSLYNAAVALQEKDSAAAAAAIYRRIVEQDAEYALAWNNLGALSAARGEYEEAEEYYRRAVSKRHDVPEAYANLVALYLATRNYPQAKRWIIKGRGHNPDSELLETVEQMVRDSMEIDVAPGPQ